MITITQRQLQISIIAFLIAQLLLAEWLFNQNMEIAALEKRITQANANSLAFNTKVITKLSELRRR